MKSLVGCTIDLDARVGRQDGHLRVPTSTNDSAWGSMRIPITSIGRAPGPTLLLLGGNHGDESAGSLVVLRVLEELGGSIEAGRVIALPFLSKPAVDAGTRLWPDGSHLNRSFPGDARGAPAQMLAHWVSEELLPRVDVVLDLHSGGSTLSFLPLASLHRMADDALYARSRAVLAAMALPVSLLYSVSDRGQGLLCTEAERQGKVVLGAELGGASVITPGLIGLGVDAVGRTLAHLGMAEHPHAGPAEPMLIDDGHPDAYVETPAAGLFEPTVELGEQVRVGQLLGRLWPLGPAGATATTIEAGAAGIVFGMRGPARTAPGDVLLGIGRRIVNERDAPGSAG